MTRNKIAWTIFGVFAVAMGVIQFIPAPPLLVPAQLPADERAAHRVLNFEGISNFRDLGGYPTVDGRRVKWGKIYRSGTFAHASRGDLVSLDKLDLEALIDFRSTAEKEEEPSRLPDPPGFELVEIPTLDEGNKALVGEVMQRIESGNFEGFDPDQAMRAANRQFATEFTPQFRQFAHTVLAADGAPVAWHCSAGKDRTGFASAILLTLLGVPRDVVIQDYMASQEHALDARKNQLRMLRIFKGQEAADKLTIMMGVDPSWLNAAFDEIDRQWGDFDTYVSEGLQLDSADIAQLKNSLLD